MRVLFSGLIFLFSFSLFAQEGKDPYYIQQAPVQQIALDCYQRNLDEGLSAQKRGDCRVALRWFRDAQNCPEVLKVPGRLEELNNLIAQCSDTKTTVSSTPTRVTPAPKPNKTSVVAPATEHRRRFRPSREFLLFDKPECFDMTCKEAARAFAGGYWDDAAALYRAAKNCSDADQTDRLTANTRIIACRQASQNELLQKEQDAVRQARHAVAANRANDAQQLLRSYDRSLAYRLADFANEYIAPEDNDACRQSMFDALYYTPSVYARESNGAMQIPFCYQLGDNLDQDLQVCFLGKKRTNKICAFAPSRHLLFQWDAESFEPKVPVKMEDTTLLYVDAVPDGRTLLFLSNDAYLFWRSPREIFRLPVRRVSYYCFSADGRSFFFLDPSDGAIYTLDLSDAFATRKGYSQRATPETTGIQANPGILSFAGGNGQFWLGYPDSIVVFTPEQGRERLWGRDRVFQIGYRTPNYFRGQPPYLWLNPLERTAIYTNDTCAVFFQIPENTAAPVQPLQFLVGGGLALAANASLAATYQQGIGNKANSLFLYNPADGLLRYKAFVPADILKQGLSSGRFSPDNRMFVTTTKSGKLEVWMLSEDISQERLLLTESRFIAPNTDGSKLYIWRNDSLLLAPADQPDKTIQSGPAPANAIIPGLLAAQNWLAFRNGPETIRLTNDLGKQGLTLPSPRGGTLAEITGAFHPNERQFVCISEPDSVTLFDLPGGKVRAGRKLGGAVLNLFFVPQTDEILIVHVVESDNVDLEQTVIKLWDPAEDPAKPMRTVRLQGYQTLEVAFAKTQGFIAFTNGQDIRVFHQGDLLDEITRIRQNATHMVAAMAFHPDGTMLAAGYEDGSVVFWDIASGHARYTWAAPPVIDLDEPTAIARLRFIDEGRRLQILFQSNELLTRDLEVSSIRAGVQTDFRKLISFQPSQIREYDLEQALDYPNNFTRLAASGDLPLIRSFFDYFQETALFSNNIQRVGYACNRAAALFAQLDAGAQGVLRPLLLNMFEDYHWKLLLRNQTEPAQKVADAMKRDFGNPAAAVLASAHTALLQNDQSSAAKQYAEWVFRSVSADGGTGMINPESLDSLYNKVLQLLEYNLIQEDQFNCICSLFGSFPPFDQRCSEIESGPVLLDAGTALRWRIFEQMNRTQFLKNNRQKVQLLEAALKDTRLLQRQKTPVYQATLENVVLALGSAYTAWGVFEYTQEAAVRYYQFALDHLNANGPFQSAERERQRLADIVTNFLYLGKNYQNRNQLLQSTNSYRQGLAVTDQLLRLSSENPALAQRYQDEFSSQLQTQLGYNMLLQGNADAALQAFEHAQNDRAEGIHRLYFGHTALLNNNEIEALLEYGNIYTERDLGTALFDIEQMAGHLPEQSPRLLDFLYRMRTARLQTRQQMDATRVDYYWAANKIETFRALQQWDSTLFWSKVATDLAGQVFKRLPADGNWQNNWLNGLLNQSYYLLHTSIHKPGNLSAVIQLSLEAQNFFERNLDFNFYKDKALIQTNLAHAYWLRNQASDREQAIRIYQSFLASPFESYDPWEMLLKDFRDLHQAGLNWPDLLELIRLIKPEGVVITQEDWKSMGITEPGE